jgi:PAS domain S-box-containing protein
MERTEELAGKAELLLRVNQEIVAKNQELDAIIHTAPDIIFSRQADGSRDYISDRFYEFTGAPAGSASGFGWLNYVHPEDHQRAMDDWMRCVESGANYEVEYRMRSKDGDYRWFRARAVPIREEEKIIKWYGTCSDIHDSKLLEQSIRDNAAELEKMVDRRTEELRRLSVRLMATQDEERRRIARDLHDGLGQELAVAKIVLDKMKLQKSSSPGDEAWTQASNIVDQAIQQVRTLSHLLHPPLLDEVGLLSALSWYVEGLTKRSGIEASLEVHPRDFPRMATEVETAVFRIVQEALTNVFRHSGAQKVSISLTQSNGLITVAVRDNGKGISKRVTEQQPDSVGVGIGGMKQRAREFGGELRLTNAQPGTLVELLIPSSSVLKEAHTSLLDA